MSWKGQKKNVVRIFNLFLEQDEPYTPGAARNWDALSEEALCIPDVYERFAYYMLNVYEPDQRKGEEHLDGSTTRNYLAIAIHLACDKFKAVGSDATKRFFDCLDTNSTSEYAKWLRGVKANIERAHCERQDAAGKKLDKSESAPPSGSNSPTPAHTFLSPCAHSAHLPADDEEGERGAGARGHDRRGDTPARARVGVALGRPLERVGMHHVGQHPAVGRGDAGCRPCTSR